MEKIMFTREQVEQRIKKLAIEISTDYKGKEVVMLCVMKGAFMFYSDLLKNVDNDMDIVTDFIKVSSYEGEESTGVVVLKKDIDADIKGKHVIIIEDIIDTGVTMSYLIEYIKGKSPESVKVCSLLDKPSRRKSAVQIDYIGFSIEDKFIYGYGLDIDEKFRAISEIRYKA